MCRAARLSLICLLAASAGGCNVAGALAYKLSQEQDIPERFKLAQVPTVVLVENFRNPDLAANDAELLSRCLQDKLEEKKAAPIVKAEKILDLRNVRPKDFQKMSVPEIARAVGAEQVIYVDLQGGGVGSLTGQSLFQGKASAAVKVVDAKNGMTLWPPDNSDGLTVGFETNAIKGKDEGSYASVRSELYDGLATQIGRQFYKWKQSEDDDK